VPVEHGQEEFDVALNVLIIVHAPDGGFVSLARIFIVPVEFDPGTVML
jgi:hypothetical protein